MKQAAMKESVDTSANEDILVHASVAEVPSDNVKVAVPDPFDPAQFAASSTVAGSIGVTKELVTCLARKPNKQEFIRVHPGDEYRLPAHILELKQEGETYLVMPAVAESLPGETRRVELRLTVSRQGSVFLWPVPELPIDGRNNPWTLSARSAAKMAEDDWVRLVPNMHQSSYDVYRAPADIATPAWPNKPLRDILEVTFGEAFIIRDGAHPVIKRLMGQA